MTEPNSIPPQSDPLTDAGDHINISWWRFLARLMRKAGQAVAGEVATDPGSGLEGGGVVADGISLLIAPNGVENGMIRQGMACSVIGRFQNSLGDVADIQALSNNMVLGRFGNQLEFRTVASIPSTVADGDYGDITVSGVGTAWTIDANVVSNAKFRQSAALSVVGRSANSTGNVADIAAGTDNQVLRRSGTAIAFGAVNLASSDAVTGDLALSNLAQGTARSVLGITGNATADYAPIQGSASQFLGINAAGTALAFVSMSGDATLSAGAITLATANANTGTWGSATQAPAITLDAKGRATAASNVTITPAASSVTGGAALTKTDDTNVTLTLGGAPSAALLAAASITVGWTGILSAARGGTANGFTAFTGPSASTKTFTLPNASDTIACLGLQQVFSLANAFATLQVTGSSSPPVTGSGTEITWDGTRGNIYAFDRSGVAYLPMRMSGTAVDFAISATPIAAITSTGIEPATDNTFYLGRNSSSSPKAWKGLIMKDQVSGTYYRIDVQSGALTLTAL